MLEPAVLTRSVRPLAARPRRRLVHALLLVLTGVLLLAGCAQPPTRSASRPRSATSDEPAPTPTAAASSTARVAVASPVATRPSDGYPAPPGSSGQVFPLAVMIDNHPQARPQSGLLQADVVYEALAEGGVTRFMAIYLDRTAPSIGPVRSARDYFIYLAAEYRAALVHVGSSPNGYTVLRSISMRDLDETYGHAGFQRLRSRPAPHNAYTDTDAARAALRQLRGEPAPGTWGGLRFRAAGEVVAEGRAVGELYVEYVPWEYALRFMFDPATRRYLRVTGGAPHRDAESGAQIAPTNVLVLTIPSQVVDDVGRLRFDLVGSGKALTLVGGKLIEGSWSKSNETAPIRLRDATGQPILLNPGQVWVQIVPNEAIVTVK